MHVLTVKLDDTTYEIHLLNPGDRFEGFGGSKHPLIVGRDFSTGAKLTKQTASMVVRECNPMSSHDTEYDIYDPQVWAWIAALINDTPAENGPDATATAGAAS